MMGNVVFPEDVRFNVIKAIRKDVYEQDLYGAMKTIIKNGIQVKSVSNVQQVLNMGSS